MTPDTPPPESATPSADRAGTVLLVEDDAMIRASAKRTLELRGYPVLEARDGEEALRLCAIHHAAIGLILTDLVMPQMNGWAFGEQVGRLYPGIRILYMSGYTDLVSVFGDKLGPGTAWLRKPFRAEELLKSVREMIPGS
ncbi:MAG: multi-sensor hybrid histidine kinase [Gemmatimonadetes bacterium]|nr:multi-sensor hybrid histidine kinase [Gemmatimonadota bacterium]